MNILKDERGESIIEAGLTWVAFLIIFGTVYMVMGFVLGGFTRGFLGLNVSLNTNIQNMMINLFGLTDIFYAVPSFLIAAVIVWGFKVILRKTYYSRPEDQNVYEDF